MWRFLCMQFHSYQCAQCTPPVSSPRNETLLDFPARFSCMQCVSMASPPEGVFLYWWVFITSMTCTCGDTQQRFWLHSELIKVFQGMICRASIWILATHKAFLLTHLLVFEKKHEAISRIMQHHLHLLLSDHQKLLMSFKGNLEGHPLYLTHFLQKLYLYMTS